MQLAEAVLWLTSPAEGCTVANRAITATAVPLASSSQVFGPILGAQYVVRLQQHMRVALFLAVSGSMPILGAIFVTARGLGDEWCATVTDKGFLLWSFDSASMSAALWLLNCIPWWLCIATPFLLWWRPLWQALAIAAWGLFLFVFAIITTDSPASNWCGHAKSTAHRYESQPLSATLVRRAQVLVPLF